MLVMSNFTATVTLTSVVATTGSDVLREALSWATNTSSARTATACCNTATGTGIGGLVVLTVLVVVEKVVVVVVLVVCANVENYNANVPTVT